MPVWTIAKYTIKGYLKEKVLLIVFVFAFILMVSSYVLSPLAVGAQQKIIIDIGLASISLFGVLLIVLLGAGSHYREREKGCLAMFLSKPISRVDFLLGKFLGMVLTVAVVMASMTGVYLLVMLLSRASLNQNIFWAIYLSLVEVLLITSIMVFFSSFSSPILSAFFTICVFVSGHLSKDLFAFSQHFGTGLFKTLTTVSFFMLPNLSLFNIRPEAVHDLPLQDGFVYSVTIYGFFYAAFVLLLSALIFRSKDLA